MDEDTAFDRLLDRVRMQKSESTAKRYVTNINQFRDWLREHRAEKSVFEADVIDVEDNLSYMDDEGYAPSSITVRQAALSAFYEEVAKFINTGRLDGYDMDDNPAKEAHYKPEDTDSVKTQETKDEVYHLKPEQVDDLAENVPSPTLRNELIIRLLFQTGVRRGELVNIELGDINRQDHTIRIRAEKSHRNRIVGYRPTLENLLGPWIDGGYRDSQYYADESPYLFPTNNAEQIAGYSITRIVRQAADNADIQEAYTVDMNGLERVKVTPHVLRHSFAMEAVRQGWNIHTLKNALGHKDLETTSIYLHSDEEAVKEAYRLNGPGGRTK